MAAETRKLIAEVAARNGIRIEDTDPVFAVCTINRLMMEDAFEALTARVRTAIGEFEAAARTAEAHAGKVLADQVKNSAQLWRGEIAHDIQTAGLRSAELIERINLAHTRPDMLRWGALGLLAGLFVFGCGMWLGLFIR